MTTTELAAIAMAAASVGTLIVSLFNRRAIHWVHLSINSRMDDLLKLSDFAAHAAGKEEGRQEQRSDDASSLVKAETRLEEQRRGKP